MNQPVEKDLQMLKDLGLDPNWDSHDFSDQEETGGGGGKLNVGCQIIKWGTLVIVVSCLVYVTLHLCGFV